MTERSMASPSSGGIQARSPRKKKHRKSTLRVITEILVVLLFFEFFAYQKLTKMEFEDMQRMNDPDPDGNPNSGQEITSQVVSPKVARQQRNQEQQNQAQTKVRRQNVQKMKEERIAEKKEQQSFNLTHDIDEGGTINGDDNLKEERLKTAKKLEHMGISGGILLSELPPWSQILENFNSYSMDDEPVVLGLEQCENFRKKTPTRLLGVAPAGMFSTGTNLIAKLVRRNCVGPQKRIRGFALIQVPVSSVAIGMLDKDYQDYRFTHLSLIFESMLVRETQSSRCSISPSGQESKG